MKKIILLILCIAFMMSSCQRTPDNEIVIGKNSGEFENAMEEELAEDYSQDAFIETLPERWEASYEKYDGKLKMEIDADIIVSDAINYPVAVIEPYYIPIEQTNKIIEAVFGTLDVYDAIMEPNKAELEERIIEVKAELQQAKNDDDEDKIETLESVLAFFTEELKDAPESVEAEKYNGEYKEERTDDFARDYVALRVDPYDITTPALQISNVIKTQYGSPSGDVSYDDVFREMYNYDDPNLNKLSYDENPIYSTDHAKAAIATAFDFLEKCGIEDRVIDRMIARVKEEGSQEISGYFIGFARKFNDITVPAFVQLGGSVSNTIMGEEEYIAPYMQEMLIVEVEGDEIVWFSWSDMYSVKEIEKEDIRLMPFDEVMANAEGQLSARNAMQGLESSGGELYVDEIILTYAVEPIKNKKYEYMLVPVWAFYGGHDYKDGFELSDGTVLEGRHKMAYSLLTINAVDGTIIQGQ